MPCTRPEKLFGENSFLKIFIKVTCFWVWAKNVWHDAQNVFCVQWNSVGNLNLLGKINVFLSIPHIMWTFSSTSTETCRAVKLAFIISNGTFWGKVDWMKQFSSFHHVLTLSKKHWIELSHLLPRCRRECSERKHNFELYSIFFNLTEWIPVDLRTAIYVSRRTFLATFLWKIGFLSWFWDFEQNSCKTFR